MSEELIAILSTDLTALDDTQAIELTGKLIDLAAKMSNEKGLLIAMEWCTATLARISDPVKTATLYYFEANAWDAMARVRAKEVSVSFHWAGPVTLCQEKELISLRRAKNSEGFEKLNPIRRCQILTNLGNLLDHVGRFSEAIECFDLALAIEPKFGMAWGNRGIALTHYSQVLPHIPHPPGLCATIAFSKAAEDSLQTALQLQLEGNSFENFQTYVQALIQRNTATKEKLADLDSIDLGSSDAEREYRQWALVHRLFLNPLNDLGSVTTAAADVLYLPQITVSLGIGPYFESFFNQIKQEFVSARYLLFEGVTQRCPHFSDSRVSLADTEDYPIFGLAGEKIKLALRSAYSLFDKMVFFLNYYLSLGIPARNISFRRFWYQSENAQKPLKLQIEGSNNWALRGLYWMAKDLHNSGAEFQDATEPDARELDVTRNHAEHKFLAIHDDKWPELEFYRNPPTTLPDGAYFAIGRQVLIARSVRVMKLARSALIYLAYAVFIEEMRKRKEKRYHKEVFETKMCYIDDDDKPGMIIGD
ncbi:LA2681 family HEPN domain-containing protein [Singulisphaera sp. PoT]|uniref:LA2681 family HEPN domain-containing protein n=1 Tax=Singulisphaera sp. PoT TaxID=3411797 RepID=UPI003BF5AB70